MRKNWNLFGWSCLVAVFIGMSVYLLMNPTRTGVVPNYRMAASHWWANLPIYGKGTHGFLYFPQFILLFSPFHFIRPEILGEIVWRGFGFGLFAWALWSLARLLAESSKGFENSMAFAGIVLLAVPASLASLNNGQTNLPLSASLVLAMTALREGRWTRAAIFLCLMVILKPISLAPCGLVFMSFPEMRKPMLLGFLALAGMGFLHPDLHYAMDRWEGCLRKIGHSYTPENLRVSDLFGMLEKAHVPNVFPVNTMTRLVACGGALVTAMAFRRFSGPQGAVWAVWVGTALLFTIFNPRAETNSYVLISPLLAFMGLVYFGGAPPNRLAGWILALACVGLMCDGMGRTVYRATDVWLKPLLVIAVSPLLFPMPNLWKRVENNRQDYPMAEGSHLR